MVTFVDEGDRFIISETAFLRYNPLLPDQRTAFTVMAKDNPAIDGIRIEFKEFLGSAIAFRDERQVKRATKAR